MIMSKLLALAQVILQLDGSRKKLTKMFTV